MNRIKTLLIFLAYIIIMFFILGSVIKASNFLSHERGMILSNSWTSESMSYLAVLSFSINAVMYFLFKEFRCYYLIVFGFSLMFQSSIMMQVLGVLMMVLGFLFQFPVSNSGKQQ